MPSGHTTLKDGTQVASKHGASKKLPEWKAKRGMDKLTHRNSTVKERLQEKLALRVHCSYCEAFVIPERMLSDRCVSCHDNILKELAADES